ncbi:MAG: 5'-3' exoribonuclease [Elusimicrobia bacterium]|nr:5'-3' exoribonuclease [Elusimicrobiota bacterium]
MIDLQLHTSDSDGTWGWKQVLEKCLDLRLTAFAITDHDTIVRRNDILAWAKANEAMAIPGVELSTTENGQTVHLLGYFLEGPLEKLEGRLAYLCEGRRVRNKKIVERLQSLGISVNEEDVYRVAGSATVGRPHIARLLIEKGVVKTLQEAFDRYLSSNGSAYYPKDELPLREAIDLLHEAGAVASVAHPGLLKRVPEALESSLKEWRSWGLDGIEAVYPSYSLEQTAYFERIATKYGFIRTGGSDFHGDNKPHIKIGTGTGHLNVPDEFLEPLLEKRNEYTRPQQKV